MANLVILGDEIVGQKLAKGIKDGYARKMRQFALWLSNTHPECVDDTADTILIPLPCHILKDFLTHVSLQVDPESGTYYEPPRYHSFSHVGGYKSAIINYYRKMKNNSIILRGMTSNIHIKIYYI